MANAAQHHHGDDHDRLHQAERLGRHEALERTKHGPCHAAERCTHGEGQQLHVAGVDAHGLGGDFVLANGHPGAANTRVLQAVANDDGDHHQRQEKVVIQRDGTDVETEQFQLLAQIEAKNLDRIDLANALGAVGQVGGVVQVVQENADDFAKTQRHDGQVVPSQLQGGRPQQRSEKRRQ